MNKTMSQGLSAGKSGVHRMMIFDKRCFDQLKEFEGTASPERGRHDEYSFNKNDNTN